MEHFSFPGDASYIIEPVTPLLVSVLPCKEGTINYVSLRCRKNTLVRKAAEEIRAVFTQPHGIFVDYWS